MHRFIVSEPLTSETITVFDRALSHQLERVLRLAVGESVVLTDGKGHETQASILEYTPQSVVFIALGSAQSKRQTRHTTLYLASIKNNNFEDAVEKSVEAGIDCVVPIITERTIKKNINSLRLTKIIKEATEQSGRAFVPELKKPMNLKEALANATGAKFFCDSSGKSLLAVGKEKEISIFIGPEGGFTPAEVALAKKSGCSIIKLGSTTLRAETAATVASYFISQL